MGKPEQDRLQHLLQDTVTLLCKNSLQFSKDMKIECCVENHVKDDCVEFYGMFKFYICNIITY